MAMKHVRPLFLPMLAAVSVFAAPALAQEARPVPGARFVHQEWTPAAGLPINQLTGAVQGPEGYLWFSTYDGLVRFDGVRFTIFNTGNSPGLPTNRLTAIGEDGGGRLWIQSELGHLIERREGEIVDHTPSFDGARATTFHAGDGGVWAGTSNGIYHLADSSFAALHVGDIPEVVTALLVDSRDVLWVGTAGGGLYRASDGGRGPLVRVDGLGTLNVRRLAEHPSGEIWIGGRDRVFRLRDDGIEELPPAPGMGIPIAFHFPRDGPVWVQGWDGLWALVGGEWVEATTDGGGRLDPVLGVEGPDGALWAVNGSTVFRDGDVLLERPRRLERILFDHEGTAWVTGSGLHRLRRAAIDQRGSAEGWVDNVYVIHEDRRGRVWLGSQGGGLVRVEEDSLHRYPATAGSEPSGIALAVHEDRRGEVWVALWSGGVCRVDDEGCAEGTIERLGGRRVSGIHEDRTGAVWFGTSDGVFRYDVQAGWLHLDGDDGLPHPDVRTFAEDGSGRIWMGTYGGGLALWDGEGIETIGTEDGLSSSIVRSLYMDAEGVLWVGTEGRGLNRVVPADSSRGVGYDVTVYRSADGLFTDGLHQILEDDFGRLWMSSNAGIFWVAKSELTAFAEGRDSVVHSTSYSERDGLLNREMNGGVNSAGIKDSRGQLWFGGIAGVARIDPATIQRNEVPPPVAIETVTAGTDRRPVLDTAVELMAGERDFEIGYTALSFVAPENMRFRYRLDGFNDDWVDAAGRRTAFYTNVPPGEYTFRVAASNNDGVWNEDGATLAVSIAPYFHETWPARAGLALLLMALGVTALRYRESHHRRAAAELESAVRARTRTIRSQAERLEALDEAKSRFFADISHEFRTPLTLTIGPLEDVRDGLRGPLPESAAQDIDLALRSARRLLELVDQVLDVARLEAGQMEMRAARGDIRGLITRLVHAFTPLAERHSISLRHRADESLPDLWFDSDLIEKVLANLLSNALKFTPPDGAVLVSIEAAGAWADGAPTGVCVSVKDSGPGIPADELPRLFERFHRGGGSRRRSVPGTGIGLSLASELVELHGGSINVESEEGFGTTFRVTLPAGTGHLPADAVVERGASAAIEEPTVGGVERSPAGIDERSPASVVRDGDADDPGDDDRFDEDRPDDDDRAVVDDPDRPLVLVVDDNADVRAFVKRHLAPRFRVIEAGDGAEALERAAEDTPDLILSDVVMPGLDGVELLRALRADPELEWIPVVFLSARADVEDRVRGLQTGAADYLTKPFRAPELVARVDNIIRSRERLRDRPPARRLRPSDIEVVSADDRFLEELRTVIEERMSDEDFDVVGLARAMAYSRSALYRRLDELDVGSPADIIRTLRLERAAQLLAGRAGPISHIAYGVGFKSVSHFSRSFRERFGVTPSAYRDRPVPTDGD